MSKPLKSLPLLKGTLDLLVLKALSFEPMHGYGITTWLERCSKGTLEVEDSALYQALHRLEGKKLVEAEWGVTENNRRARYYQMTTKGQQHFAHECLIWERYTSSVSGILALRTDPAS